MSLSKALTSGVAGAVALNLVHETARHLVPEAPRVHKVAMRAIARPLRRLGRTPPDQKTRYGLAMAGDLAGNTLYYSLIGLGNSRHPWARGAALGLVGGLMTVALPGPLGLGSEPVARSPTRQAMTVGWYTLGGLAAAAVYRSLVGRDQAEAGAEQASAS
jgi:hypothetical protein